MSEKAEQSLRAGVADALIPTLSTIGRVARTPPGRFLSEKAMAYPLSWLAGVTADARAFLHHFHPSRRRGSPASRSPAFWKDVYR